MLYIILQEVSAAYNGRKAVRNYEHSACMLFLVTEKAEGLPSALLCHKTDSVEHKKIAVWTAEWRTR